MVHHPRAPAAKASVRAERGFTLVELMVVVVIVAVLVAMVVAIAVPMFAGARGRADDAAGRSVLSLGHRALKTLLAGTAGTHYQRIDGPACPASAFDPVVGWSPRVARTPMTRAPVTVRGPRTPKP